MTLTLMPEELVKVLKPDYVSPIVAYLCHEDTEDNGVVIESSGGWFARQDGKEQVVPIPMFVMDFPLKMLQINGMKEQILVVKPNFQIGVTNMARKWEVVVA